MSVNNDTQIIFNAEDFKTFNTEDLLTQCLHFEMIRTITSSCVPNLDSAPSSTQVV